MPKGNAEEFGKFIYIEPNNLNGDGIDNAIPHDYEDYSMAVNLEVRIPRRDACGSEDETKTLYFSSDNGTISFFGGSGGEEDKQGFLTTNYTDVSVKNVGEGNKECLGIKNIQISYDSWFFPMVVIDFVDVRGASLMMPQEEAFYKTELSNSKKDITQLNGGSFFKALFSFPQPLFKLTVKGFYGRPAVYNLAVLDFKSNFNSQSGNFECRVQFKGYMYGVYADIPMTYLSVAPYINATDKKYNEFWKDFYFLDDGGQPSSQMLTYPELNRVIASGITNMNKMISETDAGRDFTKLQKKKSGLEDIQAEFNSTFSQFLSGKTDTPTYIYVTNNDKEAKKLNSDSLTHILNKVKSYDKASFSENDAKKLQDLFKPLEEGLTHVCNLIKDKNTKTWSIEGGSYKTKGGKIITSIDTLYKLLPNYEENGTILKYGIEAYLKKSSDTKVRLYSIIFNQDVNKYLLNLIEGYKNDESKAQINLNKEKLNQLRNILGFLPSIQNMFNMAFAHMETFVNAYYQMLDNIRIQMQRFERNPSRFGITGNNDSDLPSQDIQTPPFPLFIKERIEGNVHISKIVPPWEVSSANSVNMEEVKFVDELIAGAKLFTNKIEEANKIIEGAMETPNYPTPTIENLIPVTLYDFNHADTFNPYKSVAETYGNSEDKALQTIVTFFLRAYYFYLIFDDLKGEKAEKYFGRMEALNFKKAMPQITSELRKSLLKNFRGKKAINYLLRDKNGSKKYWNIFNDSSKANTNAFFSTDTRDTGLKFSYEWLKRTDENGKTYNVLPIGEFNINKIKDDIISGEFLNSEKYITIADGEIKQIQDSGTTSNKDSFKIYTEEGNYFSKLFETIKNSDDEIPDVRDSMINQVEKQTAEIIGSNPYYMSKFTIKTIKNGKEKDKEKTSGWFTNEGNLFYEYANNNYRYFDINEAAKNSRNDSSIYGVVGDGTAIDGNMDNSLFTGSIKDFYNSQVTNQAKAYLYLMSLPLDPNLYYGERSQYGYSNGNSLMVMLLREGAIWWRAQYTGEPILFDQNFKIWGKGEIPIKLSYDPITGKLVRTTLSPIAVDKNGSYITFNLNDSRISNSRKETLINFFLEWTKSTQNIGFEHLRKYLEAGDTQSIKEDLYGLLSKTVTIMDTSSRIDTRPSSRKIGTDKMEQTFNEFLKELDNLYQDKSNDVESSDDNQVSPTASPGEMVGSDDIRFSTYLVLKNLYDKWFCGKDRETWQLPREGHLSEKSDFYNMHFIDSYFNEIGTRIICNPDHINSIISQYMPSDKAAITEISTEYNVKSLYEFLSLICEKCGMTLMSLPLMYGLNPNDKYLMEDMFDAVPFSKTKAAMNDGQTYMCVYSYKPSEHLDLSAIGENEYEYVNDTFDIADTLGRKSNILPATIEDVASGGGLRIPAFGVTYAKQNQSYFKNIGVNMENPQVTEASIAMTQLIASKGGDGPRESAIYGQDLYRVYSNYSYTCNVDMMGNSQVMPLMYFQLNNIPMFRGAYMITKVTHNIAAGTMTTQFTGVRQNKDATPLAVGTLVLFDQDGNPIDMGGSSGYYETQPINNYKPVIQPDIFNCDEAIIAMNQPHSYGNAVNICGGLNYKSYHYCAEWVKFYAKSAGAIYFEDKSVGWAWNMRRDGHMEKAGFECVEIVEGKTREGLQTWSEQNAQRGDIAIMPHDSGSDKGYNQDDYGHVCMWNDTIVWKDVSGNMHTGAWVSDFVQTPKDGVKQPGGVQVGSPWVYGSSEKNPPRELYIYRWAGTRQLNGKYVDKSGKYNFLYDLTHRGSKDIAQTKEDPKEDLGLGNYNGMIYK